MRNKGDIKMAKEKRHNTVKTILSLVILFAFFASLNALAEETEVIKIKLTASPAKAMDTAKVAEPKAKKADFSISSQITNPSIDSFASYKDSSKSRNLEDSLFTASLMTTVALNVADYFTTMKALKYNNLQEANPLMAPVVKKPAAFAAVKVGVSALNFLMLKKLHKKNKTLAWVVSTVSNFALSYVVANNLSKIQKVQGM